MQFKLGILVFEENRNKKLKELSAWGIMLTHANGRFLLADAQGMYRYYYVNGNPIKYNDPGGHFLFLAAVAGFIAGVFSAVVGLVGGSYLIAALVISASVLVVGWTSIVRFANAFKTNPSMAIHRMLILTLITLQFKFNYDDMERELRERQ